MNLQTKILGFLIPLVVVPLVVVGWIAYQQLRSTNFEKTVSQVETILDQLAFSLRSELEGAKANTHLLGNATVLKRYLLTTDENNRYALLQPALLRLLHSYLDAHPSYHDIAVIYPNGEEDTRVTRGVFPLQPVDTPTPRAARDILALPTERGADAFLSFENNGEATLSVVHKVFIRDPSLDPIASPAEFRGYLVLAIALDFLKAQLEFSSVDTQGFVVLTDPDGAVILADETPPMDIRMPERLERAVFESENRFRLVTIAGEPHYAMSRSLAAGLHAVALVSEAQISAVTSRLALAVFLVTLVAVAFTAAVIIVTTRYLFIKPIQQLTDASQEIGRGNLAAPVAVSGTGEFAKLAESFRQMALSLHASNEQIRFVAYHDALTGLPNRRMFKEHLSHAIARARRGREKIALLFLDLDNFKYVNDTLGHHAGDRLLSDFAKRVDYCVRGGDYLAHLHPDERFGMVARLGGDEFVILLTRIEKISDVQKVAERVVSTLSEPFSVEFTEFYITASLGITVFPDDAEDTDALIKNADIAMYHAKEQGRNNYQFFSEAMNQAAYERASVERALRQALELGELELYYQPQVDIRSGAIIGLEALLRWNSSEYGSVPPGRFVPLAEETGLVRLIGRWVVQEVMRQLAQWRQDGFDVRVSVNISSLQVNVEDLSPFLGHSPGVAAMDIELTETSLLRGTDHAVALLRQIRDQGTSISLDDFGVGYSSLSQLRKLPIDRLKIDRSFIHDLSEQGDNAAIVAAILAMARTLNLQVIAEGVETDAQLGFLKHHGCNVVQGFIYSKPVPAADIPALLSRRFLEPLRAA